MATALAQRAGPPFAPTWQADAGKWVLQLHLVLSPLVFSTWTADAFEGPKALLLLATGLILAGLAASAWIARGAPIGLRLPMDLATLGLVLFVGSAAVSTVFSISPLISWRGAAESCAGLQTLLNYLAVFLATRSYCRTAHDARGLLLAVVVGSSLSSVYALIQAARLDPVAWEGVSAFADHARPFGMMGHANFLAAYLVMTAPLVALFLFRAVAQRRWGAALALVSIGLLMGVAVVAALSRAAWLAGGVAVLAVTAGWFLAGSRRAALTLATLTALVAVGVFFWWTLAGPPNASLAGRVAERLGRLDDGEGRWQIWRASWNLFRDRPLLGWGPDAFQLAFGTRRPADYANVEWDVTPTRSHNIVLHILATQGLLGAAAAAVVAAGLVRAVVQAWRRSVPAERPLVVAVAAGVTAFLVQDLFGFTVVSCGTLFMTGAALLSRWSDATPNAAAVEKQTVRLGSLLVGGGLAVVLFLVNVGWSGLGATGVLAVAALTTVAAVWRLDRPRAAESARKPGRFWSDAWTSKSRAGLHDLFARVQLVPGKTLVVHLTVALATLAALYAFVIRPVLAGVACAAGDRIVAAEPGKALGCYEYAVSLDPDDDRAWTKSSAAAQLAARQAAEPAEQHRLLERARTALERAAALVPAAPYHHANLGRLLGEMAADGLAGGDEAVAQWDVALAADPINAAFLAEGARTALAVGARDRARQWTARGLTLYPNYGLLHSEQGACDFADGRLEEAAAALDRAVHADWRDDREGLTHALATWAAVDIARRKFEQAGQLAEWACSREPAWGTATLLKARAFQALGRRDEARAAYQRLLTLDPENAEARAALASSDSPK